MRMIPLIQQFLERYSITGTVPDVILLHSIANAFSNLPYENVTKILKDTSSALRTAKLRDMEEVLEDHLRWNTGGTCFSLCNALQKILDGCGFQSFIAMADMHYGKNIHCAVIATVEGRQHLLDPGYLLHQPIPLPSCGLEVTSSNPMNTVIVRNESPMIYSLFTCEHGQEKWRYRLKGIPVSKEEFERHWIHSFSLNSMESVTLIRMNQKGRLYFRKDRLELVNHSARQRQNLHSNTDLAGIFGIPADLLNRANLALLGR